MKTRGLRIVDHGRRSLRGWNMALLLLILGATLALGATFVAAHDTPSVDGLVLEPQTSDISPSALEARPPVAISGAAIRASEMLTHTLFLPIVVKAYPTSVLDSAFGLQIYYDQYTRAETIAKMGAGWIRIPLYWSQIEPVNTTPTNYQWPADLGEGLVQLSTKNMKVILTLGGNPSWAADYPAGPVHDTDDLKEFMVAAVKHYGAPPYNVKHWEIYNEPDNGDPFYASYGWGYFGHKPLAYIAILSAIYQPMKTADPEAQIVFGGIAYDNWTATGGPFIKTFPDDVLANGGGAYFDVMNFHYYVLFHQEWDPYGPGIVGKYNFLRDKLASYGLSKPLVCTEASMWSDETHGSSEEVQSRYVPQVFAQTMAAGLQATIWFMLQDDGYPGAYMYGLLNSDSSPKPAYFTYQTLSRQLANAEYLATLDPAEDGSGQIEAYEFTVPGGPTHVIAAWSRDDLTHPMSIKTAQVVQVDRLGNETTLYAGPDGFVRFDVGGCNDGPVQLIIGRCPVYLRFVPTN